MIERIVALEEQAKAAKEAILKAETAADKRFASINEFRAVLTDQQILFARKDEMEIRFRALEEKINMLYSLQLEQKGRLAAQNAIWMYFMGAVGIIGTAIAAIPVLFRSVK